MIVFYFEEKGYGGVGSIIINFIKSVHSLGVTVKVFNYENDVIDNTLKKQGLTNYQIIDIDKTPRHLFGDYVNAEDVLVVTGFDVSLQYFFKKNPRLFFYNVWVDALVQKSFYRGVFSNERRYRQLLQEMLNKDSLAFMDQATVNPIREKVQMEVKSPQFLPITVEVPSDNTFLTKRRLSDNNIIKISYVGRAVNWKIFPLEKILIDIEQLKPHKKIVFNLVVDSKANLERLINLEDYSGENIQFNVFENVPIDELGNFLVENSHIHFGMGTTVLDGAKMGVPSVVVDWSYKPFPKDYLYSWLFQTKNFYVGDEMEAKFYVNNGTESMADILAIGYNPEAQLQYSKKCYAYVNQHHNLKENIERFNELINGASFRVRRLKAFIPHYFGVYKLLKLVANSIAKNFNKRMS